MSARNTPPVCAEGVWNACTRRGTLAEPHAAVQVSVEVMAAHRRVVIVEFRGDAAALLAAGCATEPMLDGRKFRYSGLPQGAWWYTHRRELRFLVSYWFADDEVSEKALDEAFRLPGVRDLFPEGFAERAADGEVPATSLREWEARQRPTGALTVGAALRIFEAGVAQASGVEATDERLRDLFRVDPRARFRWRRDELARVQQFVRETEARYLALLDSMRGEDTRHTRLQVVVDNTRGLP